VAPEAADAGPIALVADGDRVLLDVPNRRLDLLGVDDDELERRRAGWKPLEPRYTSGVLAKYAKLVGSAAEGAVCG
jgi:dihydroxy-acid dehydratase